MRVGSLGAGLMGGKLGTIFARAGHEVVGDARAGTSSEAAKEADAVLLAVHWSRIDEVLKQSGARNLGRAWCTAVMTRAPRTWQAS
jgi:8-hydroxy-5-deazaflavin:NADPH oxidoreductase